MIDTGFYEKHLHNVSRSFALCISRLDTPLQLWVGQCYLLCRVLDTIEDAAWPDNQNQMAAFDYFAELTAAQTFDETQFKTWQNLFPPGLPDGEAQLIKESEKLFQDCFELPVEVRQILQKLLNSMLSGMRYFATHKTGNQLVLPTLADVNRYCLFVAGIVGEALTKLLAVYDSSMQISSEQIRNAHHFGLFLQKVNLLKDQKQDLNEGRNLIPNRELVYQSLLADAEGAMHYIESLPIRHQSYRVFCLWSFFLGLRTLPVLLDNKQTELKVSREDTLALFNQIERAAGDPKLLCMAYERLVKEAKFTGKPVASRASSPQELDVLSMYAGELKPEDFKVLGYDTACI